MVVPTEHLKTEAGKIVVARPNKVREISQFSHLNVQETLCDVSTRKSGRAICDKGRQLRRLSKMFHRLIHPAHVPHVSRLALLEGILEIPVSISMDCNGSMGSPTSCTLFGT